ncbi:uncharacterized protein [Oscarella lobularis]|uniref:uncharacterized protein isoform X2 n=1 Tax=Oscarella lobularis TaxID=121494 RepID=UPI0033137D13
MDRQRAATAARNDYGPRARQGRREPSSFYSKRSPAVDRRRFFYRDDSDDRPPTGTSESEREEWRRVQHYREPRSARKTVPVEYWTPEQVAQWIFSLSPRHFTDYAESFRRHHITGSNLYRLDYALLAYLGVHSVGHQIDILQAIDRLFPERLLSYGTGGHNTPSEPGSASRRIAEGRGARQYNAPPETTTSSSTEGEWAPRRPSKPATATEPRRRPVPDPKWFYPSDEDERAASLYHSIVDDQSRRQASAHRSDGRRSPRRSPRRVRRTTSLPQRKRDVASVRVRAAPSPDESRESAARNAKWQQDADGAWRRQRDGGEDSPKNRSRRSNRRGVAMTQRPRSLAGAEESFVVRDSGVVTSPPPPAAVAAARPEDVEFRTSPSHRIITPPTLFRQPSVGSDRPDDPPEVESRSGIGNNDPTPPPAYVQSTPDLDRTPSISSQQSDNTDQLTEFSYASTSRRRESKSKRTPVIFAFSAEQAEDDELIAHRLAAILQQAKGSIVKKMQAINTAHGRCVSVRLEQNSVRHLRHLLETDRNSLSPLDASSVQIGNERPISLKRPQSMMRALEDSQLRTQNTNFLKVVVAGDTGCGKTSFIRASVNQTRCNVDDYTPTVFDTFDCCVSIGKEPIMLQVHDTGALEGYEKLRSESYRDADAVVVCFNIGRQSSLHNVEDCWHPEVKLHAASGVPIIVAGLQMDLREEYERNPSVRLYRSKHYTPVQEDMGKRISRSIRAVYYGECSALTLVGVKELFDHVVYIAYEHKRMQCKKPPKKGRCNIL